MSSLLKVIFFSIILNASLADASKIQDLKLRCEASDGSIFLIDQFQNDPCRIRRVISSQEETLNNVSLCLFPDDVHDEFSFWNIIPAQSKAELQGELLPVGDFFQGTLSFSTRQANSGYVSLDCWIQ